MRFSKMHIFGAPIESEGPGMVMTYSYNLECHAMKNVRTGDQSTGPPLGHQGLAAARATKDPLQVGENTQCIVYTVLWPMTTVHLGGGGLTASHPPPRPMLRSQNRGQVAH